MTTAVSTEAALNAEGSFDVAVLDVELGEESGIQLGRELLAANKAERVVFYTAIEPDDEMLLDAARVGWVVPKGPACTEQLIAAVESCPPSGLGR